MASPFGRILLITGNDEFLRDQVRAKALASVKETDPGVNVVESDSTGVSGAELVAMTGPSLFSETSVIVLREIEKLGDEASDVLVGYADQPSSDISMILIHSGGNKGRGLLTKLKKCASVDEVAVSAPKYDNHYAQWVRTEVRDRGRSIDDRAAAMLVTAVGKDLRALAAAIDQLSLAAPPGGPLTLDLVGQYFGGRAEVKTYEITDAAFAGDISGALERTRWAIENAVSPVYVVIAFAGGLRSLAAVAAAGQKMSDGEIASAYGMPPFRVASLRKTLRAWSDNGLAAAIKLVAQADVDVKGGAAEPDWVIERLIIDIAKARNIV